MLYVSIVNWNTKQTEHYICREMETRPCTIPLETHRHLSDVWLFTDDLIANRPDAARSILTECEVWIHSSKFLPTEIEAAQITKQRERY